MSNDNRDTQFKGFAKALMRDLNDVSTTTYASIDKAIEAYELAIARRAYDLVRHAVNCGCSDSVDYAMKLIPDMTELPKEKQ